MSSIAQCTSTLKLRNPLVWEQITDEFELDSNAKQAVDDLLQAFEKEEDLIFKRNFYVLRMAGFDSPVQGRIIESLKEICKEIAKEPQDVKVRKIIRRL